MRIKLVYLILGLLLIGATLQRCALISQGSRKEVSIKSYTDNAKIFVDGELRGTDTVIANLRRGDDHTVKIKKSGCKTYTEYIESSVQLGFIRVYLLFIWFPPVYIPDILFGAWCTLEPVFIGTELTCKEK